MADVTNPGARQGVFDIDLDREETDEGNEGSDNNSEGSDFELEDRQGQELGSDESDSDQILIATHLFLSSTFLVAILDFFYIV